jgi:hypothetical protein
MKDGTLKRFSRSRQGDEFNYKFNGGNDAVPIIELIPLLFEPQIGDVAIGGYLAVHPNRVYGGTGGLSGE